METLQQMAFDALEEAGFSQLVESNDETIEMENEELDLPEGAEKTENDDGSVTYTLSFSIDPKVQKEKAAAMKKGIKREDQPDAELEDAEQPVSSGNEAEDSGCQCCVQDEAPFADVLDSIGEVPTEDAGRHKNTPLENCHAKNSMYCPYHGTLATKKFLEDEIAKLGGAAPMSITADTDDGHTYKVSITVPPNTNGSPYVKALSALMSERGLQSAASITSGMADNQTDEVHEVNFTDPAHKDHEGQFAEWVDHLLEDYTNDNNSPLAANDVAELLGDYADYMQMPGDPWGDTPQDAQKKASRDALENKYHSLRAQVDMADVQTPADAQKKRADIGSVRAKAGDWWNAVSEAKDIWAAAGVKSGSKTAAYPQQAQAIRSKFQKKYKSFYNTICAKYEDANDAYNAALQSGDMNAVRDALHALDDYSEIYADAYPAFKKVTDEYTDAARKYALQQGVTIPPYQPRPWTP